MTLHTVQQIQANIDRAQEIIKLDKALERLESNQDFKAVIIDGYLEKEAVRLVHLKSDPAMQNPSSQASVTAQIDAIGGLVQYFRTVGQLASIAAKSIAADETERDELLAEELQRG